MDEYGKGNKRDPKDVNNTNMKLNWGPCVRTVRLVRYCEQKVKINPDTAECELCCVCNSKTNKTSFNMRKEKNTRQV